jgi:protein gp37
MANSTSIELPQLDRSKIEWTGVTWNCWQGCIKVSRGCKFCYMYRDKKRYGKDPSVVVRSAPATFNKPLRWQREVESGVRTGQDRFVFTCSWSDWFIDAADQWRDEAWEIIRQCPGLIFQLLTKRPERIIDHLPGFWDEIKDRCWLGTSAEDQQRMDERTPHLEKMARLGWITFLSIEPLLGPVQFPSAMFWDDECPASCWLDWCIVGGESGPGARPMHPQWARHLRDQCTMASVPFFFKQWGAWMPDTLEENLFQHPGKTGVFLRDDGKLPSDADVAAMLAGHFDFSRWQHLANVGKKAAGRLLDGRTWDQMPEDRR